MWHFCKEGKDNASNGKTVRGQKKRRVGSPSMDAEYKKKNQGGNHSKRPRKTYELGAKTGDKRRAGKKNEKNWSAHRGGHGLHTVPIKKRGGRGTRELMFNKRKTDAINRVCTTTTKVFNWDLREEAVHLKTLRRNTNSFSNAKAKGPMKLPLGARRRQNIKGHFPFVGIHQKIALTGGVITLNKQSNREILEPKRETSTKPKKKKKKPPQTSAGFGKRWRRAPASRVKPGSGGRG